VIVAGLRERDDEASPFRLRKGIAERDDGLIAAVHVEQRSEVDLYVAHVVVVASGECGLSTTARIIVPAPAVKCPRKRRTPPKGRAPDRSSPSLRRLAPRLPPRSAVG
jgi:hypothetical protein